VAGFASTEVLLVDEFLPEKADYAHIERNPTVLDIQAIATLSETYVRLRGNSNAPRIRAPPEGDSAAPTQAGLAS